MVERDQPGRSARSPRLRALVGPEVLTAASDNDPTNVGTAVLVGAQTGYRLSWVALLVAPLLAVVLAIAAQVGIVARSDLQSLVAKQYGQRVARALLVSVVSVNLVTIAADLQAGAAGIGMLAGVGSKWFVAPLGVALVVLLLVGKYDEVVAILRYVLVGFLAFGAAAVLARPNWLAVLRASLIPHLSLGSADIGGATALIGTTLTTYVYLWETIAVGVESEPTSRSPDRELRRSRVGAITGAVSTAVILWFMLITSAATLGLHHQSVSTAQDAALALRPLAGSAAADVFAVGLITSAIVALPVLMASTAHVIGAEFNWRRGLSAGISRARGFYIVLAVSIALGAAIDLANVPLLKVLVAASIIGGIATPIGLVLLLRLARNTQVMGDRPISPRLAAAGWLVTLIVGALGAAFIVGSLLSVKLLSFVRSMTRPLTSSSRNGTNEATGSRFCAAFPPSRHLRRAQL